MSAKRRSGEATAPGEVVDLARERFAQAIGECARAWRARWERAPTTHELVSAFEVCLGASADDLVADPATVRAVEERDARPAAAPAPLLDPALYAVTLRDAAEAKRFGVDECELWLRSGGRPRPWCGDVRALLEITGDTLLVDVFVVEYGTVKTFAEARKLLHSLAISEYLARSKAADVTKVVYRNMDGLDEPEVVDVPVAMGPTPS
jgi:hypothetical protein